MIKLKVTGMTCQHCENAVSEALSGVDKVVSVSHERDEAVVEGSPDVASLVAAVKDEGYEAEASQ